MFVKLPVVLYLGMGNVACETMFGLIAWIFVEYPLSRIFRLKDRWRELNLNTEFQTVGHKETSK